MTTDSISTESIAQTRMRGQLLEPPAGRDALDVVTTLGALQAQDYAGALWSIGLRIEGATATAVEAAFERREIVRTWPMRGTLHVIPARDARWMLELLTPRVFANTAGRRANLGLDDAALSRAATIFSDALRGGNRLTRDQMMGLLDGAGIPTAGQRGYHILFNLSMARLIVFGPREGKDQTFVLFDEWLPDAPSMSADKALALLVHRYFAGHGPATAKDFARWSGLTMAETRAGLAANDGFLVSSALAGTVYWMSPETTEWCKDRPAGGSSGRVSLLPGFDEYLLGYQDRSAVLAEEHSERLIPGGNGVFRPTVVIGGHVAGTWTRTAKKAGVIVEATPFTRFTAAEKRAVDEAAERYRLFLDG